VRNCVRTEFFLSWCGPGERVAFCRVIVTHTTPECNIKLRVRFAVLRIILLVQQRRSTSAEGPQILIVDDEPDLINMLTLSLTKAGLVIQSAEDGASGLIKAREWRPALIVLDLMMPQMSGLEVCKLLKADPITQAIPIIMLTAKGEEIDRIVGLELGADDYVTKPFSPRELILRIKAVLRRGRPVSEAPKLNVGAITVDPERHHVSIAGKSVRLTAVEFKLLAMLMRRPGRVHGRDRLLTDVWGYESSIDTRTVDTHVRRLRDKLGKAAHLVETIRGFGYRLKER
jgi:DNA-binding response OmpR family regulator